MVKYYDVFLKKNIFLSFDDFEEKLINLNCENKRTGDIFEQFIKIYLILSKDKFQIDNEKYIFLFNEIPDEIHSRCKLEDRDMGVDGYFQSNNKDILFQCKFSKDRKKVDWKKLSTFVGEAYKANVKYVFTNGEDIAEILQKHNVQKILYNDLANLDEIFFLNLNKIINNEQPIIKLHDRREHQTKAIKNIVDGFANNNRGKYISACGSGKTLTALWLIEDLKLQNVLLLVPNLALIKQTLDEWSDQKSEKFKYLCVCSDKSADSNINTQDDEYDIEKDEFYIPPTTDPNEISLFIKSKNNERKIIFSTYQSLNKIHESIINNGNFEFDLIIFDEAHRTAGVNNNIFGNGLQNDYIKSKKRLFMTATERILKPRVKTLAINKNLPFSDMSDEKLYGPIFSELTFGDAIALEIITDYEIIVSDIQTEEYIKLINENNLVKYDEKNTKKNIDRINNLFIREFFKKAITKFNLKKTFIFHNKIKNSEDFVNNLKKNFKNKNIYIQHIDGKTKSLKRKRVFASFNKQNRIAAISNAKCLTEGVDVPTVDGVLFANQKKSIIDIIQAAGRSMRKDRNNPDKKAKIIIPIISSNDESINKFEILTNTIQAMREIDNRFAEVIDKFHYETSTGNGGKGDDFPIIYDSKELNLDKFKKDIKINIYNCNSVEDRFSSHIKPTFLKTNIKVKYAVKVYKHKGFKKLIDNTKNKFLSKNAILNKTEIQISHNNINHSMWMGLIEENNKKFYLSLIGKKYFDNKIDFKTLFKEAMFKKDNIKFYPYLAILKILSQTLKINFLQYLYGICFMQSTNDSAINKCIYDINHTQNYDYINLKKNKNTAEKVLQSLNNKYNINFSYVDVFEQTKHLNYFTYAADHFSLTCSDFLKYDTLKMELKVIDLNNLKSFIKNK